MNRRDLFMKRVFVAFAMTYIIGVVSFTAYGESTSLEMNEVLLIDQLTEATIKLQPLYLNNRDSARVLTEAIYAASKEHGQDPWVAIALGFRESSLSPIVGYGARRGPQGEVGFFQIMPNSVAYQVCGNNRDMTDMEANIDTAMCFLSHAQKVCRSHDPWVYVSAYGMVSCPSPERARTLKSAKRLDYILRKIGHNGL